MKVNAHGTGKRGECSQLLKRLRKEGAARKGKGGMNRQRFLGQCNCFVYNGEYMLDVCVTELE